MATQLFLATVVGTGTGGTTQTVTVPFSAITGNNCLAVLKTTARVTGTTFNISATFDGVTMTQAVEASGALGGFGEGSAAVFYLAVGNLAAAAGDAVFTITSSNGLIGRIATLVVYSDMEQASPLRDTDTNVFVSSGTNCNITLVTEPNDICLDCVTLGGQTSLVPFGGQTQLGNVNNGSGNGDATQHGSSVEVALSPSTAMGWTIGTSSFAYAGASFIEDATPGSPTITLVTPAGGPGAVIRPNDTNIDIDGTGLDPGGNPTVVILSPTTGPGDPLAEQQAISSVTSTSANWDAVTLGAMSEGPLFLFVRVDPGGPGEEDSAPFPVIVSNPDVHFISASHTTTGATGPTVVVSGLPFKPVAAALQLTGVVALETIETGVQLSQCLVDLATSMGVGIAAQASPVVVKRKQQIGAGSLFIMDETSDGAPDIVVGTPTLTDDGLDIDFATNVAGVIIGIVFVGGQTARADLHEIQINDGSKAGLPFEPTWLIGISANMATGSGSDTNFARQSLGMAIGSGLGQWNQSTDMDTNNNRNTEILHGTFLAQLNGNSNTWAMAITALTSDGYTWSGSNPDGAFVLALNTDTAQLFLTQFASTVSADGATEDWPDSGIDNPGILVATTAARSTSGPSGSVGGRWSIGSCFPQEAQSGSSAMYIPETGVGTTQQFRSIVNFLTSSSIGGDITLETKVIDFKRAPTVEYVDNPAIGILYNIFMAEDVGTLTGEDEDAAFAAIW